MYHLLFATRCTLLLLELTVFIAIWFGIPVASIYFTWFINMQLAPALSDEHVDQTTEALLCFVFHSIFFSIVLWALLPYYSVKKELPPHLTVLISCAFGLLAEALTVVSIHVSFIAWNWSFHLEGGGYVSLSRQCFAMAVFLNVLWSLGWGSFLIFLSVIIDFGIPSWLQQMLLDTRMLLAFFNTKNKEERK
ncbi:hypothetical protein HZ326_11821 [Fusarium oxysporum f. sp. albedinis]|nr:hypothetical protein HZ326_11821 [Fusarium oxysporum f. sp. albedinis]